MPYEDEPTQKLPARFRRVPRPPLPLSPMPTLEELTRHKPWGPEQANQPTEPLPALEIPAISRYASIKISLNWPHNSDSARAENGEPAAEQPEAPPPTEPTNKRVLLARIRSRGTRGCSCAPTLFILGLLLVLLGGLFFSGWYALQNVVLGPLAQFFHPIGGGGPINGRTWNLLILGSDNDNKYVFPDLLTQVVMIAHIDPLNKHVSLVSIPRDSWVPVPGQDGMHKLDQAFLLGASPHHNFDDGVRLMRATIEQDYGIPIDRYAWVGLGGFASVINTLGGIDIDLTHPLVDGTYPDDSGPGADPHDPYALKRLYLPPGPQHLSGETALEYVRSRHADLIGDIGRTQRQQEVLTALRNKLNIANIFEHLPQLFRDLAGKVYTDLGQSELLSMAGFARDLSVHSISRVTLGPGSGGQNYGTLAHINDPSLGGMQDIVIPNCSAIQPTINTIFGLGDSAQSCRISGP